MAAAIRPAVTFPRVDDVDADTNAMMKRVHDRSGTATVRDAGTRRAYRWAVACGALACVMACGRTPPYGGGGVARPAGIVAVGPIAGPATPRQPGNPYAKDRTATGEGRQLFVRFNCSGCHGGRAGGGMGPSLRDVDWIYGSSDAQIFSSIVEGRARGMPAWQTRLSSDQTWKLVSYIKSLRSRNEPQAPPWSF